MAGAFDAARRRRSFICRSRTLRRAACGTGAGRCEHEDHSIEIAVPRSFRVNLLRSNQQARYGLVAVDLIVAGHWLGFVFVRRWQEPMFNNAW